jgi:hypothetical protein
VENQLEKGVDLWVKLGFIIRIRDGVVRFKGGATVT